ncbi:MAG: pilus assembly protein PilC [Hyphomicrobiales bacterium]|nr:MAG: pilus assembly protein PilC [Hyphomicrobiales bacterium]
MSPAAGIAPQVPPNVFLTLDDSLSMNFMMDVDGKPATRASVMVKAINSVFSDTSLLPDHSIRLAWQSLNQCTQWYVNVAGQNTLTREYYWSPFAKSANGIHTLDSDHRSSFLNFVSRFNPCSGMGTVIHQQIKYIDSYLRADIFPEGPWATINGPWAFEPGSYGSPHLGCRRNFHILLTDGGWNYDEDYPTKPPNFDGTARTLPDGKQYQKTDQTRIYFDEDRYHKTESISSLADWAMKSWAVPLQDQKKLTGQLAFPDEYAKAPETETLINRVTGERATLEKYWNPNNNPATWPHLVTYTIGFSSDALPKQNYLQGSSSPFGSINPPSTAVPYGTDGDFAEYANGRYGWFAGTTWTGDKGHDMWHAAINSRGRFYAVEKAEDLAKAFRSIIQKVKVESVSVSRPLASSGSTITRDNVGLFTTHYDSIGPWAGSITAETVSPTGTTSAMVGWQGQSTADRVDAVRASSRVILSWRDAHGQFTASGIPFRWDWAGAGIYLSPTHIAALNGGDKRGEARLNYVRGDRSLESARTDPFRVRRSAHGDIVNSLAWYTAAPTGAYPQPGYAAFYAKQKSRKPMLYVGANDGMLHGFSAQDGSEAIAYVPRGVIPALSSLTEKSYDDNHRYFVDGSPMTGDVQIASGFGAPPDWRTMLVGTLGAGGKGFFVLDVTAPGNFAESNAGNLVVMDKTLASTEAIACVTGTAAAGQASCLQLPEADLGHITAAPVRDDNNPQRATQITRMNDNRWAVVLGNGYNSINQRPVLLVQYLDGAKELLRIPATGSTATGTHANTTDNGLSAPRVVDLDGDGRPDVAYAGDNKGNLWKFIIASSDATQWGVAFGGVPLFTAMGPSTAGGTRALPQPISTAPIVRANDRMKTVGNGSRATTLAVGGMMVAFGTGRNVARTDPSDANVQTLYSVLDNTRYAYTGTGDSKRLAVQAACSGCNNGSDAPTPTALGAGVVAASLARQDIGSTVHKGVDGRKFWTVDQTGTPTAPSVDWDTQNGWYLDLPTQGERLLKPMSFYDGSNLLAVVSQVPAHGKGAFGNESVTSANAGEYFCGPATTVAERQYLTLINLMDGKRPQLQLMDLNADGLYNATDLGVSRMSMNAGGQVELTKGDRIVFKSGNNRDDVLARMPTVVLRPSWRHLQ